MPVQPVSREDYEEPVCPLCSPGRESVPLPRILEKEDTLLAAEDYAAAERHLLYWWEEARTIGDLRAGLTLEGELVGFYRKQEEEEKCLAACERLLTLLRDREKDFPPLSRGIALINAATGYRAFSLSEKALPLYEEARLLLEKEAQPDAPRLAALYNNMSVTLTSLGNYAEAEELLRMALELLRRLEGTRPEQAITWMNLADIFAAARGAEQAEEEIEDALARAEELLLHPENCRDGAFAYVCEKCSPGFSHYGHFFTAKQLDSLARSIRIGERSSSGNQ